MHAALKRTAATAVLALAAVTLAGCVLAPAPNYGGDAYYAEPAQVYVAPRYNYGPRWGYWHRNDWRGGGWRGGGWHGGGGHHWH